MVKARIKHRISPLLIAPISIQRQLRLWVREVQCYRLGIHVRFRHNYDLNCRDCRQVGRQIIET